jgi:Predicted metal-dependent hydrolase of the TIM-barrel fold
MIIDFHVHPPTNQFISTLGELFEPTVKYFRANFKVSDYKSFAEDLKNEGITKAILLPIISHLKGGGRIENEHIKEICNSDPDLFYGFASFDMNKDYLSELKYAINELGLKGIKIHPQLQVIRPDDERLKKVYDFADKYNLPIVIHTGITGIGANVKGGGGLKLDFGRPIYIDNVASEYPNVIFIMAHFGWPWYEEALAVAYHKANVYIDISGWSPKYIPNVVIRYMDSLLQDRTLFGSDYPMIRPSRIINELKQINLKEQTIKKILYENALKILNKL